MGAVKEMWQDEVDRILDQYCFDHLTLEEAINELRLLGFDKYEARDLLANAAA
jgi:hypothetical protein